MEKFFLVFSFFLLALLVLVSVPHVSLLLAIIQIVTAFAIGFLIYFLSREKKGVLATANKKDDEINSIIDNVTDGIIVYDEKFKILNANKAAAELLKLGREELVGTVVTPALVRNPKMSVLSQIMFPSLSPTMNQITTEGWPQVVELSFDNPSLKLRVTLCRLMSIKSGSSGPSTAPGIETQSVSGFMKIIHDETREKNILESKSEFISVAAHQLRTPLTAIKWALEHIINNTSEEALKKVAEEGHEVSLRTLKIVDDLLDASKMEQGRFGFNFQTVVLSDFLGQVIGQLDGVSKELGIKVNLQEAGETLSVRADPDRLGAAFFNIIDNAIRYNTEGGSVSVDYERTKSGSQVVVKISDTGVGIPSQEIAKLFSKFYRGSNVSQLHPNGSGLGLYITKNIIEASGGKIRVESEQHRGTTFYITLPLVEDKELEIGN